MIEEKKEKNQGIQHKLQDLNYFINILKFFIQWWWTFIHQIYCDKMIKDINMVQTLAPLTIHHVNDFLNLGILN